MVHRRCVIRNIVFLKQRNRHASEWSHLWNGDFKATRESARAPAKLRGLLSDLTAGSATFRERIAAGPEYRKTRRGSGGPGAHSGHCRGYGVRTKSLPSEWQPVHTEEHRCRTR